MRALILAAGRGSRMNSLTDDHPKCLIEFRGKALLEWQLETLKEANITEIGIVAGYKGELINPKEAVIKFWNERWNETNMVASLACAEAWLSENTCIVCYSDIIYKKDAIESLINCPAELAITYDPKWKELWEKRFDNPLDDAETFRLNSGSVLSEIGGTPTSLSEIEGQYMGLLRISPKAWSEIKRVRESLDTERFDNIHMTDMLQMIIDKGTIDIEALPYEQEWAEFDSPNDLRYFPNLDGAISNC